MTGSLGGILKKQWKRLLNGQKFILTMKILVNVWICKLKNFIIHDNSKILKIN
ncbi:hypothetical protein CNEO2_950081 [Clostridium neonatale]|nr:hypothetical protein CNEO2_950081 [Clostridium neonatale]